MASGADFWVYTGGSLQAQGTTNAPVKFTSLRHQDRYSDIPGQWGKIWFWAGSMDNVLDNVVIKMLSMVSKLTLVLRIIRLFI